MGLVDTGANVSIIDIKIVEHNNWTITKVEGEINQAFEGQAQARIGELKNAIVNAGTYSVKISLEIAKLSGKTEFIIGMDLFNKLGFKLSNIPLFWPQNKSNIPKKTKKELLKTLTEIYQSDIDENRVTYE